MGKSCAQAPCPIWRPWICWLTPRRSCAPISPRWGGVAQDYQGLASGKCQATVLPSSFFRRIPAHARAALRVIYRTHGYPNLALSAGPQVPASLRARIRRALLSSQGEALAERLFPGRRFIVPTPGTYQPYAHDLSRMTFFRDMVRADQPVSGHLVKTAVTSPHH